MSVEEFRRRIARSGVQKSDGKWLTIWIEKYAQFHHVDVDQPLDVNAELAIAFLKSMKSRSTPAWQRLQAIRAIQNYALMMLEMKCHDLNPIREKLSDLAADEKHGGLAKASAETLHGIDDSEPELIQMLRRRLRTQHYARRTEIAYAGWVTRFLSKYSTQTALEAESLGEGEMQEFLSELVVERHVSASTRNQATSALLYLFQKVLNRDIAFIESVRAKTPDRFRMLISRSFLPISMGRQSTACASAPRQTLRGNSISTIWNRSSIRLRSRTRCPKARSSRQSAGDTASIIPMAPYRSTCRVGPPLPCAGKSNCIPAAV